MNETTNDMINNLEDDEQLCESMHVDDIIVQQGKSTAVD